MDKIKIYLRLIRVKQWVKNAFIFMPIIFGGHLGIADDMIKVTLTFFVFCVLSSAVYILNDIKDMAADKLHPKKKTRPLAAGLIGVPEAAVVAVVLLVASIAGSIFLGYKVMVIAVSYALLHILYTLTLKKRVIIDVVSIALGFELRIWAGAVVIGIAPSVWLQLCIFVLALFLGFIKRRHEMTSLTTEASEHRGVLLHYTVYFLDQIILIAAALCIIFYGLYVLSDDVALRLGSSYIAYTVPFVVYGIFRYLYLVHVKKMGGDPGEVLTADVPFLINILLWVFFILIILYK